MSSIEVTTRGPRDGEPSQKRERVGIAAQACQTCRSRKSKCDEQRPKCGLCHRLDFDCQYREPPPTKKDKTMVQILEALNRLETKFDAFAQPTELPAPLSVLGQSIQPQIEIHKSQHSEQLTYLHRVIVWPSILVHLVEHNVAAAIDLQYIIQRGSSWLVEHCSKQTKTLDARPGLQTISHGESTANVSFPSLSVQQLQTSTEAYFHTFNVIFPILEQESFVREVLASVREHGYGYDAKSVLALLVHALGHVALQGIHDGPVDSTFPLGGIRGGTVERPPGLEVFNEARRRISFLSEQFTVEYIQCHLLLSVYYGSNGMHLQSWSATTAASTACQALIRGTDISWTSTQADSIKRTYWTCHLMESLFNFDLLLPQTGIQSLHEVVPLPRVNRNLEDDLQHEDYFYAMLTLEKIISNIGLLILEPSAAQSETTSFHGPPMPLLHDMAQQLDAWRSLLPQQIRWTDKEMLNFPSTAHNGIQSVGQLFTFDQDRRPIRHRYNLDIVTAHIRTRFYYARYLIYLPFVYKALHFPEILSKDDIDCTAMAIKSACLWPISMAPVKNKKRLVPFLFTWTQSFMSILLILEMTRSNKTLSGICEEQIDPEHVRITVKLLLEWLNDVRQWDGIAAWSCNNIEPLF